MLSKSITFITLASSAMNTEAFFGNVLNAKTADEKSIGYNLQQHRDGSVHLFGEATRGRGLMRLGTASEYSGATSVFKVHGSEYVQENLEVDGTLRFEKMKSDAGDHYNFMRVDNAGVVSEAGFVDKGHGIYECTACNRTLAKAIEENEPYFATEKQLKEENGERTTAVTSLTTNLSNEKATRIAEDNAEATSRTTADNAEATSRAAGDATLTTNLSNEKATRIAEDTSLQTRVGDVEDEINDATKLVRDSLPALLDAEKLHDLDTILSAMLTADFDYSTGIFAIHNAQVNELAEGSAHSRADTLCMIKILCNTLGISFEKLYNTAVDSSTGLGDAIAASDGDPFFVNGVSTDLEDILARGTNHGFRTVEIAQSTLTVTNLD